MLLHCNARIVLVNTIEQTAKVTVLLLHVLRVEMLRKVASAGAGLEGVGAAYRLIAVGTTAGG